MEAGVAARTLRTYLINVEVLNVEWRFFQIFKSKSKAEHWEDLENLKPLKI